MGRSIEVTNAGVYIEINKTEKEVSNYFEKIDTDIVEWSFKNLEGQLFNQGEMPQNILCVSDKKYDLSANINLQELDELYESFTTEYETALDKLTEMFGEVFVKIGIIEYSDETC